jgi:hypothetical protein
MPRQEICRVQTPKLSLKFSGATAHRDPEANVPNKGDHSRDVRRQRERIRFALRTRKLTPLTLGRRARRERSRPFVEAG